MPDEDQASSGPEDSSSVTASGTDTVATPGAGAGTVGSPPAQGAQAPGMSPPQAGAAAQSVPAMGNEARGRQKGRFVVGALHSMLMDFSPFSDEYKSLTHAIGQLSKHFKPDDSMAKGGQMPPMSQVGRGQQGQPQGQMPQMAGGPMAGQGQRGPVPMPGGMQ